MALKGKAKRVYQKQYMRQLRAGKRIESIGERTESIIGEFKSVAIMPMKPVSIKPLLDSFGEPKDKVERLILDGLQF